MIGIDGFHFGRPGELTLAATLDRARAAAVSYDHVGSTLDRERWPDHEMHEATLHLGDGRVVFDRARDGLERWVCHRGIGATIHPSLAPLEVGTSLLVVLPAGPASIVVPNRVVAVVDELRRFGFVYGTLEGHHERGEELFLVEHRDDDSVWGTLRVDAVIASLPARAVAPAVRRFQSLALRRYLEALRDHVRTPDHPGGTS